MVSHNELNDDDFLRQLNDCSFPAELFNHEAHLRFAWLAIHRYELELALFLVPNQLQQFVTNLGSMDKYNHTVTIAALKAVNHFMNRCSADSFTAFLEAWPRLNTNFKDLMGCHYGIDIFSSADAMRSFLKPDLLPFD